MKREFTSLDFDIMTPLIKKLKWCKKSWLHKEKIFE